MKRIYLSVLSAFLASAAVYAQGEMDAFNLSRNDLKGTARSVSMGGAFGALGGDVSAITINPAGIGIYQTSEVVTTLNFQNVKTKTKMPNPNQYNGTLENSKFNFSFDNLAFVGAIPVYNDVVPFINIGFAYNRLKTFDRKYETTGVGLNGSITDFLAMRANGYAPNDILWANDNDNAWNNKDWFAVLGYNGESASKGGLINATNPNDMNQPQNYKSALYGRAVDRNQFVDEKGYINSYDFNLGTTFSDMISAGITVSATEINYRQRSQLQEFYYDDKYSYGDMLMNSNLKTEGTGWQVHTGVIFKPIHELRIGVAYHSPTWYQMTNYYNLSTDFNIDAWTTALNKDTELRDAHVGSPDGATDYKLRTPDKWTFSLAGVIGQYGIISVDYELTNYKNNMKLFDRDGYGLAFGQNQAITEDFRNASTLRIGAEARITPQFSARVGYAWMQSPLVASIKDNAREVVVTVPNANYVLDGDINHITWGLGYRFTKNFYADMAFVVKTQKSDAYSFPSIPVDNNGIVELAVRSNKSELTTNTFQGLLTFGLKF